MRNFFKAKPFSIYQNFLINSSFSLNQIRLTCQAKKFQFRSLSSSQDSHFSTVSINFNSSLNFDPIIPLKILDSIGEPLDDLNFNDLGKLNDQELPTRIYQFMVGLTIFDTVMNNLQRHGRISFYMTSFGEEGAIVGSASALGDQDEVFAQYREQGVLLWRGCSLDYLLAQCFGTMKDLSSQGRQMPVHYASKQYRYHSISSPLATQIPQAAGAAYALKRSRQKGQRLNDCVICYSGEGAASEGDFHAGVNMASVLGGPIVFFIRNNGFAISTPHSQQYRGDGIASRASGYGIDAIRVDGNDPLAVFLATQEARRRALEGDGRAVMVEAMTYRVGHHSTSDDSSAYRNPSEVEKWRKRDNPINRMRNFLELRGWWNSTQEEELVKRWKSDIALAIKKAEKTPKAPLSKMWTDTYATEQKHLSDQKLESERIIQNEHSLYKIL
ncbi:hypothetical protein O181_084817 [Austropuccinia psidii MF-1]|uniref:2-oxoisovalerate dehydrogenase subunit alpha n=1 Tax=Austropuccinia psidii MF-1 TaxID=1389203 RepID=A0A9Q3FWX9_9BASI|nr:hypothetical protein [Austropuccinia psidii MF-1]